MGSREIRNTKGAVTLEAALIMPVFLYLFVNLMTLLDAVRVQTMLYAAVHQTGREIGIYAFDARFAAEAVSGVAGAPEVPGGSGLSAGANVLSTAYAASRVRTYLEESCPNLNCVEGGADGISFLRSGFFSDTDTIDLVAACSIKPLLRVFPFTAFPVEVRYFGHAWTGYAPGDSGETQTDRTQTTVYVAKTGTVYHTSPSCTYLNPGVRTVASDSVAALRNESGGKYYPCEVCGGGTGNSVVITGYGDRYHKDANCAALARTFRAVSLEEASGLRPCSKCGISH